MGQIDRIISFISALSGIAVFLIPNLTMQQKLFILLCILWFGLLYLYFSLLLKHSKLLISYKDSVQKHKALAKQFDKNSELLIRYRTGVSNIVMAIFATIQSTEKLKVSKLAELFLQIQRQINDGGDSNE